jgi:AAA family ATP:ADP antiporter
MTPTPRDTPSRLDRWLNAFTVVKPGEGRTALLLAANVFLLLMAYYVLKPVREALILGEGSAELKSYMSAFQVGLLAVVIPAYGSLVSRLPRIRLINVVTAIFVGCLAAFFAAAQAGLPIAIPFFLWIGIFNLMIVAQFWSFANDVYTKEEGERLFVIIGFGASLGAVVGARVADRLIEPLGINLLLLLGAAILVGQVVLTNRVDSRERVRRPIVPRPASTVSKGAAAKPNAFAMVLKTRYLLFIALMLMLLNLVNTTGEYILGSIVGGVADDMVAAGNALSKEQIIGDFYSKYFSMVNVLGLVMQLFLVSRIVRYLGMGWAVMILPLISLGAYNILMFFPLLYPVLAAKVLENSTDYSLNNTVRNMLFLPCTYEEKFSAKQAIDSFFVRMGDVLSALLVFVGTTVLVLGPRGFAAVNAALVVAWLALAWRVGRMYAVKTEAAASKAQAAPVS